MTYFKVIKDCNLKDCVPAVAESDIYKAFGGVKADTTYGGEGQFVTSDGVFFNIENAGGTFDGIMVIFDVNGYRKKPNEYGKDVFFTQVRNERLLPMGAPSTIFTDCYKHSYSSAGIGCLQKVIQGIDY